MLKKLACNALYSKKMLKNKKVNSINKKVNSKKG